VPGSVELVEPITARDFVENVYAAHHRRTPGEVQRQGFRWDWTLGLSTRPGEDRWNGQVALYRDPGGVVAGFVCFSMEESWVDRVPATTVMVDAFVAATDDAYAAMWRLLCEVDTTRSVRAEDRSADELLPWLLTDARAVRQRSRSDFLWTRVLDVATAFGGRTCAREGSVALEVIDPLGYATGRFELTAGPAGASAVPTTRTARITLPVQTLSAVLLGGARLALLARAGLVEATDDGALALADAMLASPVTPWCSTWF
jgi:predicted acetyltransferase